MTFINLNNLNDPTTQAFLYTSNELTSNALLSHGVPADSENFDVIYAACTGWLYDHADAWFFGSDSDDYETVLKAFWAANPIWSARYPV